MVAFQIKYIFLPKGLCKVKKIPKIPKKNWKWVGGSRSHSDKKKLENRPKTNFCVCTIRPCLAVHVAPQGGRPRTRIVTRGHGRKKIRSRVCLCCRHQKLEKSESSVLSRPTLTGWIYFLLHVHDTNSL